MPQWITDFSNEIGAAVMAFLAGFAAYIKAYELAETEWTPKKHLLTAFMRQFYAVFASLLVWYAIKWAAVAGYPLPEPAIPLLIGVAAYNGVRVVDIFTTTIIDWFRKRLGLEPKP